MPRRSQPAPAAGDFGAAVVAALKRIPRGRVSTYGEVAMLAGRRGAARQVVRVLKTHTRRERLPWHRVINSRGEIALPPGAGFEEQRDLLRREGVEVSAEGRVDLKRFGWRPRATTGL